MALLSIRLSCYGLDAVAIDYILLKHTNTHYHHSSQEQARQEQARPQQARPQQARRRSSKLEVDWHTIGIQICGPSMCMTHSARLRRPRRTPHNSLFVSLSLLRVQCKECTVCGGLRQVSLDAQSHDAQSISWQDLDSFNPCQFTRMIQHTIITRITQHTITPIKSHPD